MNDEAPKQLEPVPAPGLKHITAAMKHLEQAHDEIRAAGWTHDRPLHAATLARAVSWVDACASVIADAHLPDHELRAWHLYGDLLRTARYHLAATYGHPAIADGSLDEPS